MDIKGIWLIFKKLSKIQKYYIFIISSYKNSKLRLNCMKKFYLLKMKKNIIEWVVWLRKVIS